jgi:FK506-binding nuclear protein
LDDEEIEEMLTGKRKVIPKSTDKASKKAKIVEIVEEKEVVKTVPVKTEEVKKLSKKEKKAAANAKKEAEAKKTAVPAKDDKKVDVSETKTAEKSSPAMKRTLDNGITIEDKVIGTGPRAKNGAKVGMRYIGKLTVILFLYTEWESI